VEAGAAALSKSDNSLEAEAKRRNYNPVQLALAWLLHKSPVMLPIPGTANIAHLEENMAAAKIQLTPEEWKKIEAAGS
jgi:pyridoxine 4-dehydrogenase